MQGRSIVAMLSFFLQLLYHISPLGFARLLFFFRGGVCVAVAIENSFPITRTKLTAFNFTCQERTPLVSKWNIERDKAPACPS